MEYIRRTLEDKFLRMSDFFKVVLVTGARQVGKTTMLRHLAEEEGKGRGYVSLDDPFVREAAQSDPALFFQVYKPPVIIDEVQKAPQLFEQIKIIADSQESTGQIWLTGSQQYSMMRKIRESLAGRIGIAELYGLSQSEIKGVEFSNELDFSLPCLLERKAIAGKIDAVEVFDFIWRGGMPQIISASADMREEYFNSYTETYLMRDASEDGGIANTMRFRKFLSACAALAGEQVNYRNLAEAADISQPTAKEWLNVLCGMGIVFLLPPFSNNALKRLTKTPKLYFCDTGLCAYLSRWLSRDTLMNGAASGHFFENFVVSELLKNYAYAKSRGNLFYLRNSNAKEIDIIVEENNRIHPLEIKKSASPDRRIVKTFSCLDNLPQKRGGGGVICMCDMPIPIDERDSFIPCNLI
ncbi:MAG: ATP-binding protein [Synergistes sp.]|nr:ATP-binding protein [Synergistes sp.]